MSIRWHDIMILDRAQDASHAIDVAVNSYTTPSDAVELIGARRARELTPEGGWHDPVPAEIRESWMKLVFNAAFLRWETAARHRLVDDEVRDTANRIVQRAAKLGIRLARSGMDTISDYFSRTGEI